MGEKLGLLASLPALVAVLGCGDAGNEVTADAALPVDAAPVPDTAVPDAVALLGDRSDVVGRTWHIEAARSRHRLLEPVPHMSGTYLRWNEADDTFDAHGPCNEIHGRFEASGNALTASDTWKTTVGCPTPWVERLELAIGRDIEAIAFFTVVGDELVFTDGDGNVTMVLGSSGIPAGETYAVPRLDDGFTPTDPPITFAVHGDGTVTGSAGCNDFSASIAVGHDSISITDLAAGDAVCPDSAVMAMEQQFLAALPQATTYRVFTGGAWISSSAGTELFALHLALDGGSW